MNNTQETKELLQEYTEYLTLKNYKQRGIEDKVRIAGQFLEYASRQELELNTLCFKHAEAYREDLSLMLNKEGKMRFQPATINGIISSLKLFYSFLIAKGKALSNPFFDVERMKEGYRIPKNILTVEQMEKLLNGIKVTNRQEFKFKVIIELLYSTGARISEIEGLTLNDINLDTGYITIKDDKERQDRKAPLTEYALKLLRLYLKEIYKEDSKTVFPHGKKRTLNRWVNDRLKRIIRDLKLPEITCHGIRHTIATHLFKSGAGIRDVQEFLGHRRIKNTEIYTKVLMEDLKKAVEKNHPREVRERDGA